MKTPMPGKPSVDNTWMEAGIIFLLILGVGIAILGWRHVRLQNFQPSQPAVPIQAAAAEIDPYYELPPDQQERELFFLRKRIRDMETVIGGQRRYPGRISRLNNRVPQELIDRSNEELILNERKLAEMKKRLLKLEARR